MIQTDKRKVTHIITDIEDREQLAYYLYQNKIPYDGILIECNSKRAYVWIKKTMPNIDNIQA
jgi:flagellar motor switch protein FliG